MITFTDELKNAIRAVSGECASDLAAGMDESGEKELDFEYCLSEVTLDANRIQMHGHPKAQKDLDELLKEHSFSEVVQAAKSLVCY